MHSQLDTLARQHLADIRHMAKLPRPSIKTPASLLNLRGYQMTGIVGAAAIMLLFAFAGVANAGPPASETITTTLLFPSFPSTAPFVGTYTGTFSASGMVTDTGTVTDQALFGAVPSPVTAVLQQVRTLSGSNGTLTLRCNQRVPPGQSSSVVSNTGSCVVLGATGAYAGLRGSGSLIGTTDFGSTPVTVQDTLVFG
jgi:hypothetical protein